MSRFIQFIGCWLALCFAIPSFGLTPPGISASSSSNRTCAEVTSSAASSNPAVSALTCEVRVVNQWNAGYQIEVIVKNTGSVKIDDWRVYLSVPEFHVNTSLWNAVKTVISPTQIMLSKPASNGPLLPGQSVSIGAVFNKPLGSTGLPSCHTQIIPPPNTAPKGDFSIELSNDTVHVQNLGVVDAEGDKLQTTFNFGDGTSLIGTDVWHSYKTPGSYTITQTISDGTLTKVTTREVTASAAGANRAPVAIFAFNTGGLLASLEARASADQDGDSLSYAWDIGQGMGAASSTSYKSVNLPQGGALVSLTVFDGRLGNTVQYRVNASSCLANDPAPSLAINSAVDGLNLVVDARDSRIVDSFTWDFGDGTTATGMFASHSYAAPGTYTVTLRGTAKMMAANKPISVRVGTAVNLPPVAILICGGGKRYVDDFVNYVSTVSFDAYCNADTSYDPEGASLSYNLSWGDSSSNSSEASATGNFYHNYTYLNTTYPVTLRVSDGVNTTVKTINLKTSETREPPVAVLNCVEHQLVIDDFANNRAYNNYTAACSVEGSSSHDTVSYSIDWGDGGRSRYNGGKVYSHNYAKGGTYTITLSVRDFNTVTTKTLEWRASNSEYNRAPVAESSCREHSFIRDGSPLTQYITLCDQSTSKDPDGHPLTVTIDWGDGNNSTGTSLQELSHSYDQGGNYLIRLSVTDGVATSEKTLQWLASAATPANNPPGACFALNGTASAQLDAACSQNSDNDPLTYSWDFGDGSSGTGVTASHQYAASGSYQVTLTVSDGKTTSSISKTFVYTKAEKATRCEFKITNSWNTGYQGWLRVHNQSTAPVSNWGAKLTFVSGATVSASWNGTVTGSNPYQVAPASWNNTINAGSYVEVGFQVWDGTSTHQLPQVSGLSCE